MTLSIRSTVVARKAMATPPVIPGLYSLSIRSHVYMVRRQGKVFAALRVFFQDMAPSYFMLMRHGLPIDIGVGQRDWMAAWAVALCAQGFQVDVKAAVPHRAARATRL